MKWPSKARAFLIISTLLGVAASVAIAALVGRYAYDQPGDKRFVNSTSVLERWSPAGGNNQSCKIATPRAQIKASFSASPIVLDGVKEASWDNATPYPIIHKFNASMTRVLTPMAAMAGCLMTRLCWWRHSHRIARLLSIPISTTTMTAQ